MTDDMFDFYILLERMWIASFLSVPKTFPPFSYNTVLGTIVASPSIFFDSLHTSSNTDFPKFNIFVPLLFVHIVAS